jgi:hypothetical protein
VAIVSRLRMGLIRGLKELITGGTVGVVSLHRLS